MQNHPEYDLPDAPLLTPDGSPGRFLVWVPERMMVVIGKGSKIEEEVDLAACEADSVAVVRRGTGGCAVVISPEMVVVTFALYTAEQKPSKAYFKLFNAAVIRALEGLGVTDLSHQGISDIALRSRKVAGTAIYRNRELVFYHAIINLSGTTEAMERYLKLPPRTPDYRRGRSHAEFVTSLAEEGHSITASDVHCAVSRRFLDLISSQSA